MQNNKITIKKIVENINSNITKDNLLNNICLTCSIKSIKKYEWMYFIDIFDDTGVISCSIHKTKIKKELEVNDNIIIIGNLIINKYNKISVLVKTIEHQNTKKKNNFIIVENKLIKNKLLPLANRREIFNNYKRIGIISSKNAAGLKDSISILIKNMIFGNIIIYHTAVEGSLMVEHMINKIKQVESENKCDILLITRGGGASADLEWFNNYNLAVCVLTAQLPVVCGIGHEINKTIIDLVADKSFITPSDAANELTVGHLDYKYILKDIINLYNNNIDKIVEKYKYYASTLNKLNIITNGDKKREISKLISAYNLIINCVTNKFVDVVGKFNMINVIQKYKNDLNIHENVYLKFINDNIRGINLSLHLYNDRLNKIESPMICYEGKKIVSRNEYKKILDNVDKPVFKIIFFDGSIDVEYG